MALHPEIQAIIDRNGQVRPGLANTHLKGVIAQIEAHSDIITPEVFQQLMEATAARVGNPDATSIPNLKTVFEIRDQVTQAIQSAGTSEKVVAAPPPVVAKVEAPKVEPKTAPVAAGNFDLGDPLPPASGSFEATNPEGAGETAIEEAPAVLDIPATVRPAVAKKDPVLARAKPAETEGETSGSSTGADTGAGVDVTQLIQLPNSDAPVELPNHPVAPPTDTDPLEGEALNADDGRGLELQGTADTTTGGTEPTGAAALAARGASVKTTTGKKGAAPVSDLDGLLGQLADQISALQKENETLRAENARLSQESSTAKISPSTRKKLEGLGIRV